MIGQIRNLLARPSEPFVFSAVGIQAQILERVIGAAAEAQAVFVLDGNRMQEWAGFFEQFSTAFDFPDYFGRNLNALAEMMCDLSWIEATGFVAVVLSADAVLRQEEHGLEVLVEHMALYGRDWATPIWDGEWWDRDAIPFHAVLHSDQDLGPALGVPKLPGSVI